MDSQRIGCSTLERKKRAIHDYMGGTVVVLVDDKKEILLQSQPRPSSLLVKVFTVLVILGGVLTTAGFGYYRFVLKSKLAKLFAPPAELQTTGVRKGQGFVTPGIVLQDDRIGEMMDNIADPANLGAYLAAGKKGIL